MTSTGDVVQKCKEYFEVLFNSAVTSSVKEEEAAAPGKDLPKTKSPR